MERSKLVRKIWGVSSSTLLHHLDPTWRHLDKERYYEWNVKDVLPCSNREHALKHNQQWHADLNEACVCQQTGIYYNSIEDAAEETGLPAISIWANIHWHSPDSYGFNFSHAEKR